MVARPEIDVVGLQLDLRRQGRSFESARHFRRLDRLRLGDAQRDRMAERRLVGRPVLAKHDAPVAGIAQRVGIEPPELVDEVGVADEVNRRSPARLVDTEADRAAAAGARRHVGRLAPLQGLVQFADKFRITAFKNWVDVLLQQYFEQGTGRPARP